jgi:hypothetical protein
MNITKKLQWTSDLVGKEGHGLGLADVIFSPVTYKEILLFPTQTEAKTYRE